MKIRLVGADFFHVDRETWQANDRFPQFRDRT